MTQTTQEKPQTRRDLQHLLFRRLAPIIIGAFLAAGIGLAIVLINATTEELIVEHRALLIDLSSNIESELDHVLFDVQDVALNQEVSNLLTTSLIISTDRPTLEQHQGMQFLFTLAGQHADQDIKGLTLYTRLGHPLVTITTREGIPQRPQIDPNAVLFFTESAYAQTPTFQDALQTEGGQFAIEPVTLERDEQGNIIEPLSPIFSVLTPIYSTEEVVGVLKVEIRLSRIISTVNNFGRFLEDDTDGRRAIVMIGQQVVADSHFDESQYLNALLETAVGDESIVFSEAREAHDSIREVIDTTPGDFTSVNNGEFIISSRSIIPGSTPHSPTWRILIVDETAAVWLGTILLAGASVIVSGLLGAGVVILLSTSLGAVMHPITAADTLLKRLASDEGAPEMIDTQVHAEGDESILQAIDRVSARMRQLNTRVERELARRRRDLEVVGRIGRQTATFEDIDDLFNRAINMICNELGFYHAQVFLMDDARRDAILVYSRGERGQRLLEAGHKIRRGSPTVIGTVTGRGEPVVVNDTTRQGADILHGFNPLLPDTRAELGLPLIIGNDIIGALDIQSKEPDVFHEEDLPLYQLVADQLAIAIYNAQLVREAEERFKQIDKLNKQLTREAWEEAQEMLDTKHAYLYDLREVKALDADHPPRGDLSAEISIRGEIIGTLSARAPEGGHFSEGDRVILRAVADRIALAIENARLFQETQRTLAETSSLYQLSRQLNEANTLADVIRAIITTAVPGAASGQIWMFDDMAAFKQSEWMQLEVDVSNVPREEDKAAPIGMRLNMAEHPILSHMTDDKVTLVHDILHDTRVDDELRDVFVQLGARALVLIPLAVRGVWRGVISVALAEPKRFNEREGRLFTVLIDQAGVAIDNRLLLKQTEEALARNENLYAASRIINTAQTMQDLVFAAVAVAGAAPLDFALGLLEGQLDESGWPTALNVVAQSEYGNVFEMGIAYPIRVPVQSQLRGREPEVFEGNETIEDNYHPAYWARQNGYRSIAITTMFADNQPIALFYVMSRKDYVFSPDDYEVYRALTGQMSIQIQNQRLLEQTEAALDETSRLYVASRAISRAQDLEQVYQAASEHLTAATLRELEDTVSMRVMVLLNITNPHPETDSLTVEYLWASDKDADFPLIIGEQVMQSQLDFGGFAYSGTTVITNIEEELQNIPGLQRFLAYGGAKGATIIPTTSRQKWFGVVIITYERRTEMSEQYVRFVNAVVDQLAIAVENQQLFIEAQMEARRAQVEARRALALAEAGQLASQVSSDFTIDMGDVVARVAESAGYNRWTLLLTEDGQLQREVITSPLMKERDVGELLEQIRELDLSLLQAYTNNETLIVNDLSEVILQDPATIADWDDIVEHYGKHIAVPIPGPAGQPIGALLVGRDLDEEDLDERDAQFARTLASQIGVALENRRLFQQAERERRQLSQILSTLPAGVIVLDAQSLKPIMYNDLAEELLGGTIEYDTPFDPQRYHIHRTGTLQPYPTEDLPILVALHNNAQAMADDIAIVDEASGIQTDIIINAAPIHNIEGEITAIVAAMQDISNLRMLENTLQENLRETVTLTEAQRALSEAANVDEVLDVLVLQLMMQQPDNALIVINTDDGPQIAREGIPIGLDNRHIEPFIDQLVPLQGEILAQLEDENLRMDWLNTNYHYIMSLPLRARSEGGTIGWIVLLSKDAQRLSPETTRIYSQIADVAATTLDNRQLFLSTQIALQETARLYRATTSISRARDLLQLNEVLQEALEGLSPDYYAGYVLNNDTVEELFNQALNDEEPLDFASLLRYELPQEDGVFISNAKEGTLTPLEMAVAKLSTIVSLGAVNLRVQGIPSGRLFIAFKTPHKFTEGETRLLNAIADSASVVIDNQILFEQIQNTLEETSVLYQASRAMTEANTPEDILDVAVNFVVGEGVNQVLVMMLNGQSWDSPGATAQVVAGWHQEGLALTGITLTPEQFPAWPLLTSRSVTAIDDIHNDPTLDEMQISSIKSLDARSVIIIPLRVTNRDIGVVWVGSRNPMSINDRDIRLYQAFQEQASLAMEAAYLLQQAERRARQLETSAEVSQSAARILGLDTLLPELVDLIKEAFGYDHVQIFLMNEETDYAELKASTGAAGQKLLEIKHQLKRGSDSVTGKVTETGEPQIAFDTADADVIHKPNPYLPMTRSEMAIPLIIQGRVVGALDVQSNKANAFTEEDIRVLKTLAAQISVAIDNANLYEEAQRRASEMSFLFDITTAAAAAETLQEALEVVAERLYDSLEAQLVTVYLPHQYIDEITQETFTMVEPIAGAGLQQPLSELSEVRVNDPNSLIGIATANLQPEIIYDIEKEVRYTPISTQAKSAILVPISSGMKLIGLIVMESQRRNAFDYDTLQLLLAMAGSLAAIIQNAVLLEQLQETNEQLLELDRMKSAFLANMSHELRTPLNSIIGFSRVMLKGISGPLTEMQKQDLETIFNSGQHLLMLINDLLDQAKIAANKMELKFEYFEIGPLIEAVKSIALGLLKEKPVKLIVDIAPNLPQAYGDEFRTRQVLLNLVNNAVKFTPEGSITISVYLVENPQTGAPMIRIDITDTGIGIAEKDLPLLFEAFRQIDSSLTRTVGGTGLGLPIAKSLTEMQGGELTVQSELNVGSIFSITIPTEPTAGKEEESPEQTPDTSANGDSGNGAQQPRQNGKQRLLHQAGRIMTRKREVLLIEDDKNMVDQFRRLLQREGFEVQTADHPAYAEAMASNLRPTVIILDVNFAQRQGWNILERLKDRDDTFDIPVVVVTLDSDSERAYQAGAHTFIQRPFDPEQLVRSVLDAEKESNRERILIIDDKPDSVRLIIQTLKEHGDYRVFTADNGHDGMALVARRRPDLILLDLRMPDKDGFEVLQELRTNPETADIPVVVITGEGELSAEEQAILDGVDVIYKSAVSEAEYNTFLKQVKAYLQVKKG